MCNICNDTYIYHLNGQLSGLGPIWWQSSLCQTVHAIVAIVAMVYIPILAIDCSYFCSGEVVVVQAFWADNDLDIVPKCHNLGCNWKFHCQQCCQKHTVVAISLVETNMAINEIPLPTMLPRIHFPLLQPTKVVSNSCLAYSDVWEHSLLQDRHWWSSNTV